MFIIRHAYLLEREVVWMYSSNRARIRTLYASIVLPIWLISLSLIVTIQFRWLYYYDIDALNIPAMSGYDKAIIRENYDALIDYCSPMYQGDLSLPSLPSSAEGIQHFAEVKAIFVAFYYLFGVSTLLLVWLGYRSWRDHVWPNLKTSAAVTIILPCFVSLLCALNFERAFLAFHTLFFRNDYWLFNPKFDPIILILPSEFFLHCAILLCVLVILGAGMQYGVYRLLYSSCTIGKRTSKVDPTST